MEKINRIKEVIVNKGVRQKKLAEQIEITTNAMSNICNNKTQPHLITLKKIAEFLDVDIRELLIQTKSN
jgi:transcriptional regulator with XRE-family HTH domain